MGSVSERPSPFTKRLGAKPAKIKSFLIEKFLLPALIKIKIFAGLGGRRQPIFRKRWVGLSPAGRQLKVSVGVLFKKGSDFIQKRYRQKGFRKGKTSVDYHFKWFFGRKRNAFINKKGKRNFLNHMFDFNKATEGVGGWLTGAEGFFV